MILSEKMSIKEFAKFVVETPVPKGHLDMTSLLFAPFEVNILRYKNIIQIFTLSFKPLNISFFIYLIYSVAFAKFMWDCRRNKPPSPWQLGGAQHPTERVLRGHCLRDRFYGTHFPLEHEEKSASLRPRFGETYHFYYLTGKIANFSKYFIQFNRILWRKNVLARFEQ